MSSEEVVTTSTYITAEGKKVRKVKKKKVTIEEGGVNGSRRESEVEIQELSTTMNDQPGGTQPQEQTKRELIFGEERTRGMDNKEYHVDHFNCWHCDESLASRRYVLREEHPYCTKCYELNFASTCENCKKIIGIDCQDLSFKDKHWHSECFTCFKCGISMVNQPFSSKGEALYCAPCYEEQFSARCDKCGKHFKSGMKKLEFKGKQWHDGCFTCDGCDCSLGSQSFVPKNENCNLCVPCYEKNYADKCTKCSLSISGSGVTYKNENWHRECFTCASCNVSLAGQRFTIKNEQCMCADCYAKQYARKCCMCTRPIISLSGAKFVTFEDRCWHPECFCCTGCKESLVGKGFITDGPDIFCAECAKAKMM